MIVLLVLPAHGRDLSFEERVRAQHAIARVRSSHLEGVLHQASAETYSREVIEQQVRRYLAQSAALQVDWHTPVTPEMLRRETERMVRDSRMPSRLRELFRALDDDPVLIQECLARQLLVGRMIHNFLSLGKSSADTTEASMIGGHRSDEVQRAVDARATSDAGSMHRTLPFPREVTDWMREVPCPTGDAWDNGSLDDTPTPRMDHSSVWTGSEMIIWGGIGSAGVVNTGGRYDPATDTWRPTSMISPPPPRGAHGAIWTGKYMLIWGGLGGSELNDGWRYDPITDQWTAIAVKGAPSPRRGHASVWTGTEMIVWGGVGRDDGGRYDPNLDRWSPMSTLGGPPVLSGATVVWAEDRMIVWGGSTAGGLETNEGYRYDPLSDQWDSVSLVDAPAPRHSHAAVWTGSEMIVWGGATTGPFFRTGGRYDPGTDQWEPISIDGAPDGVVGNTTIWTGSEMIVAGPAPGGGRYNPSSDTWTPVTATNGPAFRRDATAVWTGELMIVWGGQKDLDPRTITDSGARYRPATDSWTPTSAISGRESHTSVWTGNEMIVWGGREGSTPDVGPVNSGSRYDPATDDWSPTSLMAAPTARYNHSAVWTGRHMVIWGGAESVVSSDAVQTGALYDPVEDRWSPTPVAGAPTARQLHTAVATGSEMIVWGGIDRDGSFLRNGGRYRYATATWSSMTDEGAPTPRTYHTAVWTGDALLIWGGLGGAIGSFTFLDSGSAYHPGTDTWTVLPATNVPSGRFLHSAVWTGTEMVIWGGRTASVFSALDTGSRLVPGADSWRTTSTENAAPPTFAHTAVWTGREMIVWGQGNSSGRYDPNADQWYSIATEGSEAATIGHTAVWTGQMMIVWGGQKFGTYPIAGGRYFVAGAQDHDGDGVSTCDGDCNDGMASAYPGAVEVCDGIDQDCNGAADDGDADEDGYPVCVDCVDTDAEIGPQLNEVSGIRFDVASLMVWSVATPVQGKTVAYDVARGNLEELPVGGGASEICLLRDGKSEGVEDREVPASGTGYWYLVRAREACLSSYGWTGSESERTTAACSP